jgi:hypothetical protein
MDREEASKYRGEVLNQAHRHDAYFDEKINEARENRDIYEIGYQENSKKNALRYNLKMARWNDNYWQARYVKLGYSNSDENNGLRDPATNLTAKEMAQYSRLLDVLKDFSFGSNLVEILDLGVNLPSNILSSPQVKALAENAITTAIFSADTAYDYNNDISYLSRAKEFALKFNISPEAWHSQVVKFVKQLVDSGSWSLIDKISQTFHFIGKDLPKKIHKDSFYGQIDLVEEKGLEDIFGFSKVELKEGGQISVAELVERLNGREKILADSLAKIPEIYFELRSDLGGNIPMQSRFARASEEPFSRVRVIPERTNEKAPIYKAKLCYLLGDFESGDLTRLEFMLTQNKDVSLKDERNYGNYFYFGTNTFELERAMVTNKPLHKYSKPVISPLKEFEYFIGDSFAEVQGSAKIELSALKKLAEVVLKPEQDFNPIFDKIDALGQKYEIEEGDLGNLKIAIREFAKYTYSTSQSRVGDCLITPNNFLSFCHLKFRLKSDTGRYGVSHPEWGSDGGYAGYSFYHEVNVLFGKIVIDWTVTQYSSHVNKPIPYVYEIGDELKSFGPLFRIGGGETANDPYPGTSLPEGYEIIYGI